MPVITRSQAKKLQEQKKRILIVDYTYSSGFRIPANIPLLSKEDNKRITKNCPWSWWVRYDTLHYLNADGEECVIDPDYSASDADFKYPNIDSEDFDDDE